MSNIKLNIKLSAYTKGIIPDFSNFIDEAPDDGEIYGRKDKEWVNIDENLQTQEIIVEQGSGLNLEHVEGEMDSLSIRQEIIYPDELPNELAEDTTYYIIPNTPGLFITGGTSFSEIQKEFRQEVYGGNSTTNTEAQIAIMLIPINSKGIYEERE